MTYTPPITDTPIFRNEEDQGNPISTTDLDAYLLTLRDTINQMIARQPLSTNADGTPLSSAVSSATQAQVLAVLAATSGAGLVGTLQSGGTVEAALATLFAQVTALQTPAADIILRTGARAFTANQSMGGFRLTNLANGIGAQDAATIAQLQAAVATAAAAANAVRRDGSTPMLANFDAGGFRLTNLAAPTATSDAVTLALLRQANPVGEMRLYGGGIAPTGFMFCVGTVLDRAMYPDLFTAINTVYGAPSGDTFCLPDFRGRTFLGVGTGSRLNESGNGQITGGTAMTPRALGDFGGEETHLLTIPEMPAHDHTIRVNRAADNASWESGPLSDVGQGWAETARVTAEPIADTGGGERHNTVMPFVGTNVIIRVLPVGA